MTDLFIQILNMSAAASWVILAVLLVRQLLKGSPKWIRVLLWGLAALRLLCPFSIESVVSMIPSANVISPEILLDITPTLHTGVLTVDQAVNQVIADSNTPAVGASINPLQVTFAVLTLIWIIGASVMLVYAVISYLALSQTVKTAVRTGDNIYQSERIDTPFVLGIIRPRIYLPYAISEQSLEHVLAHEKAHIRRKDHWWKPLGFLLLTVHWFNPLVWVGYILLCRDIELACDERVVKELGVDARADYSAALLSCSAHHHRIAACPVAFGEVSVKKRIKSVLHYKKPGLWVILIALVLCVIVAVCFLTNPIDTSVAPDLSFLFYENAISLVADREEVQTIYYPSESEENESFINLGTVSGYDLAYYLDWRQWKEVKAPAGSLSSPGSVEFVIAEDQRITVYERKAWSLRSYAKVSYMDDVRYYQTNKNDYTAAVDMLRDNWNSIIGTVLEIQDGHILVESTQNSPEKSSYDRFLVPIQNAYPSPEPTVGDVIEVLYSGKIPVGYPGKVENVISIRVLFKKENGEFVHVIARSGVAEVRVSAPDYSGGCVHADGSDFAVGESVYIDQLTYPQRTEGVSITAIDRNGKVLYGYSWPVEMEAVEVLETGASAEVEDIRHEATGFVINFAGNHSLGHRMEINRVFPYWHITVVNEGENAINVDCAGTVYRVPPESTKEIFSEEPWAVGIYQVSFGAAGSEGMEGYAVCQVLQEKYDQESDNKAVALHHLQDGKIEISAEELGNHVFWTNSTKLTVKVKGETAFQGEIILRVHTSNDEEIMYGEVDSRNRKVKFSNLTSDQCYSIAATGLDGCTLTISQ